MPEKRIIAIVGGGLDDKRSRYRSPLNRDRSTRDIRDRLGGAITTTSVQDRLGRQQTRFQHEENDKNLDREELESQRPDVKPWEINPEYVPRSRYYFEVCDFHGSFAFFGAVSQTILLLQHDNREDFVSDNRGGRGRGRGYFNSRGRGFRRESYYRGNDREDNYSNYRGRGRGGGFYNRRK